MSVKIKCCELTCSNLMATFPAAICKVPPLTNVGCWVVVERTFAGSSTAGSAGASPGEMLLVEALLGRLFCGGGRAPCLPEESARHWECTKIGENIEEGGVTPTCAVVVPAVTISIATAEQTEEWIRKEEELLRVQREKEAARVAAAARAAVEAKKKVVREKKMAGRGEEIFVLFYFFQLSYYYYNF